MYQIGLCCTVLIFLFMILCKVRAAIIRLVHCSDVACSYLVHHSVPLKAAIMTMNDEFVKISILVPPSLLQHFAPVHKLDWPRNPIQLCLYLTFTWDPLLIESWAHSFCLLIEKVQICGQIKLSPVMEGWQSNPFSKIVSFQQVTCWRSVLRSRRLYCSKSWWWVNLGARLDTGDAPSQLQSIVHL